MLSTSFFSLPMYTESACAGAVLRCRNQPLTSVLRLESGRVLQGILVDGKMRHHLGVMEGPVWLDAASALLGLPVTVDMVADSAVQLYRLPITEFHQGCAALPELAQSLLRDLAAGYRQQSEMSISRFVQDAEARCAQWLLQHAEPDPAGAMRVTLHERKRTIAAQLGIAPETFSRVLRQLRDHGLIAGTGTVLNLPHPQALESLAGC